MAGLHAVGRHGDRSEIEGGGAREARRAPSPPIIRANPRERARR
ncbi:conserved hypothetical protein [Burkholderia pseudomallei 305]|nr:conserved hypothetical protein [Burkholderia pseudomallei 305]